MSIHESEAGEPGGEDPRLNRILDLLESMDGRMSRLEGQVSELSRSKQPPAAGADDPQAPAAPAKGQLVDALTAPDTVATLSRILSRLDIVEQALMMADQLPDLAAGAAETIDGVLVAAADSGIDLDGRLQASVALAERLTDPTTAEALLAVLDKAPELVQLTDALVASGIGSQQVVDLVGSTSLAVAETRAAGPAPVGAFGAARSLFDKDVQRVLGFVVHFAQVVGRRLK